MDAIYEMITKIESFSSFLEVLLCTYFCSAFMTGSKKDEKQNVVLEVIGALVMALVVSGIFFAYKDVFGFRYQKRLFFLALCLIMQWIYFRRKYFLGIVAVLLYGEVAMVAELTMETVFVNMSMLSYQKEIAFLLWRILIIAFGIVILHGLIPKKSIPTWYMLVVCLITVVSVLCNWMFIGAEGQIYIPMEFDSDMFVITMIIIFFLFQIVIVFLVLKIAEVHQQKQTTSLIELNNKMLQRSIDETEQTFELWRQSVHDYKNHVIVLKHLADENRLDEIKTFLNEEEDMISKQLFMIRTGNSVVDTLVNIKHSLAEKYHIAFVVHGALPSKLVVADMDLANILGNLLDNAIEASQKEIEPYIELIMKQEKNFFILNIRNKCTESSKKELGKTSKENPEFHGIGLKSVTRIVKKYDGEMHIEQNHQEYIVNIMIQNKLEGGIMI